MISSNAQIGKALLGPWSKYAPYEPSPKQLAFCMLPHREAFAGGAAGGGKSAVLLMDALRGVDTPGYAAIIFRRSLTDLKKPGALLDMAFQWLGPWLGDEIRYEADIHTFKWSNGASLTFGYVGSQTAWEHYQGGSYQWIGWDELTQHSEADYEEMFTRLRVPGCERHKMGPQDPTCSICLRTWGLKRFPLKVRSASNPGGRGHFWVKKRFKLYLSKDLMNPATGKEGVWLAGDANKPFIPFFYTDNPGIDQESYKRSFQDMTDEQRRVQMEEGNWDRIPAGIFKPDWFSKRWQWRNGYYAILSDSGIATNTYHENSIRIFSVMDVACSTRDGVGERSFRMAGGGILEPSYTVIGTFGLTPRNELLILDIKRFRAEAPQIFEAVKEVCREWRPMFVSVETNGPGKPIAQVLWQMGVPLRELNTTHDKPANSAEAQKRCKGGRVLLPENDKELWVDDFLGEICCWSGHPHEMADQVDVLSNAIHEFTALSGNMDRESMNISHKSQLPQVSKINRAYFDMPKPWELWH